MSALTRRIRAVSLVAAIAGATVVTPLLAAPASADSGGNPAAQLCKSFAAEYPGVNVYGECMGYFNSGGRSAGFAQFICKTELVPFGIFPNLGTCISTLRDAGF